MEFYNKHYISVDERGCITNGFSDAFRQPAETDICINERGGYQFRLFPGGEENPALFEWEYMIPLYKYENGEIVKRSDEEIEADIASLPVPEIVPTTAERVAELEDTAAALEDALCEMDVSNQEAIAAMQETDAALEEALCEMDVATDTRVANLEDTTVSLEEALCEIEVANEERIAAIEEALCEIDMLKEGDSDE